MNFDATMISKFSNKWRRRKHFSSQHLFDFNHTAWKVSKYGVFFFGPYFPAFRLNTERYSVSLRNQPECRKIRTRKNSVFGHFSRSVTNLCYISSIINFWTSIRNWYWVCSFRRRMQNPVEDLRWSFLRKLLTFFLQKISS